MVPTIATKPVVIDGTGLRFVSYGRRYAEAASRLPASDVAFDPVPLHLYCQSLELYLKAFIWLMDRLDSNAIKGKYGHDLKKLWEHSKARGIDHYAKVTPLRECVIALVAPHYKRRSFAYLDLAMIVTGFADLKAEPRTAATRRRLVLRLGRSLHSPLLSAA